MRKILLFTGTIFSLCANAQTSFRFGIKGGGNFNFLTESTTSNPYFVPYGNNGVIEVNDASSYIMKRKHGFGFYGGGFMEISPNTPDNKFKLQIEVLYSKVDAKYNRTSNSVSGNISFDTLNNEHFNLQQLSLPIVLEYYIIPSFSVNLGPTINYIIGGRRQSYDSTSYRSNDSELPPTTGYSMAWFKYDIPKKIYIGLMVGAAYCINKNFFINASFNPLFGKIRTKNELLEQKIQSIQLGVGYKF